MLPCEIVEIDRNRTSTCGEKDDDQRMMQWKFKIPNLVKPNKVFFENGDSSWIG